MRPIEKRRERSGRAPVGAFHFPGEGSAMMYEVVTALEASEVIRRAKRFFAERVPMQAAFPEKEGPGYLTLRGQGGEEIALAVAADGVATRVRASTLLFDQPLDRFLSTLPPAAEVSP